MTVNVPRNLKGVPEEEISLRAGREREDKIRGGKAGASRKERGSSFILGAAPALLTHPGMNRED